MGMKLAVILGVMAGAFALEVVLPYVLARLRPWLEARRAKANAITAQTEEPEWVREQAEAEARAEAEAKAVEETQARVGAEAEKIWTEARGLIHSESPDFATDWQYMTLVYKAAELGHLEAMSKLGDYAFNRGDVVEAFYWKHRVEMNGGRCRNPSLMDIIEIWGDVGCPDGGEEVSAGFTEQHAAFAHAVLCLKSGINPQFGNIRLKELSDAGDEDAMRFLRKGNR